MAVGVRAIRPVAHFPWMLGIRRQLEGAAVMERRLPPPPAHVRAYGTGVEALVLAILDGHHAFYKVGPRLEERGMLDLLQPSVSRASRNDSRLGQVLDALSATNLHTVFRALALTALVVDAIPTRWMHQETRTMYPFRE